AGTYRIRFAEGSAQLHTRDDQLTDVTPEGEKPLAVRYTDAVIQITKASAGQKTPDGDKTYSGGGSKNTGFVPGPTAAMPPAVSEHDGTEAAGGFQDLDGAAWAIEAIGYLSDRGIVGGVSKTAFEPLRGVTRAEFLKMLLEAFNIADGAANADFTDVAEDDWYYAYAAAAQTRGIIRGDDTGAFRPNDLITREDMAVLCVRALDGVGKRLTETAAEIVFDDRDQFSVYATEAIARMQKAGVLNGRGGGRFAPRDYANRAEAAAIVYRLMK
ncbi:MAG: S-layer homology domain-containing protein, partial [Clostridiales bacterium]|nr:S-layer homology domain-containing protein [Clostridiales bacterium]